MAKLMDAKLFDKVQRIQQLGHLNDPITDGNQQVIKLDFGSLKTAIVDYDEQISDEIDYMVEKLADLDALKQSKSKTAEEAAALQARLTSLKSEDAWSKIRTDLDVAETLFKQTKEEHQGHLKNLDQRRTQLTDLYEKLRDGQKEKEQVTEKIGENKMTIVEAFQESRDIQAAGLVNKDKDICKMKNLVMDGKLELQERENEMEMEVQKAINELCRVQSENKELRQQRECIRKQAPLIEQEWDQKLDAVSEQREEANQRHRINKDNKAYKVEEYHGRTARLKEAMGAAQDEVDRAYCKLRAVDELAESVKDIHRTVTHKHAKQAQIMEDMKAQTGNFEKDANERNVRLNQKFRDKEKKLEHTVRKTEKELAEAIEGLKEQESVYENFTNEKATVERSADQVFIDAKNAEKLLIRVQNRLFDEKQKSTDVDARYKCVQKFKERVTAAGITPHLYLDKIRQQLQDVTKELETIRAGCC